MSPGKKLGGSLDDVFLALAGAEKIDAKAINDARADANIGADDDVATLRGTALGIARYSAGGSMGINGEGRAGRVAYALISDAEIEDGIFDVNLYGRALALERDNRVRGGERIDCGLQQVVASIPVQVAVGLGQWNKLGCASVRVERKRTVLFGKAKIFCNFGRERGAISLFLEKFGVDGGRLLRVVGIFGVGRFRVLLVPPFRGFEINKRERDLLFRAASLCADVVHDVADDLVAHDDLVAAVLEDEPRAMWRGRVGL